MVMRHMLYIESRAPGVLAVNGQFCGPLDGGGQAFPMSRDAEVYVQLFPFSRSAPPLTAALVMDAGRLARLEPQDAAFALLWPDGVVQLELTPEAPPSQPEQEQETAAADVLLRYLRARLAGDAQADAMLMRPQNGVDVTGAEAVVPLRFPPMNAPERFDARAGLVYRLAPNVARVDAVLAATVPAGQGHRLIERMQILRSGADVPPGEAAPRTARS